MAVADYELLARHVEDALRRAFPQAVNIKTEPGYQGRVHARIVSPEFNDLTERQKQDRLWDALHGALAQESQFVSIALAYGTNEYYDPDQI